MAGGKGRQAIVNRLSEFLIVATHAILYIHRVYPHRIFVLRQKYGVATFYSKHPDVNHYIARMNAIEAVAIVVYDGHKIHARYVFELSVLADDEGVTPTSLGEIDNQLRAHLCRLLSQESPDPHRDRARDAVVEETRFQYVLYTKGVRTGETWMPADGEERREFQREFEVLPMKDADRFSTVLQMSSRLEVSGED